MGRLPTGNQLEFPRNPIQHTLLRARHPNRPARLAIAGRHVEIAAQHDVGIPANRRQRIQDRMHTVHVTTLARRTMNRKNLQPASAQARGPMQFAARNPTGKTRQTDGRRGYARREQTRAPASAHCFLPQAAAVIDATADRARLTFLREQNVGRQFLVQQTPMSCARLAAAAQKIVGDYAQGHSFIHRRDAETSF
jgi:hypothetical protein